MRTTTLIIVSLVLVMYFVVVLDAAQRCKGKPTTPKCEGLKDLGNNSKRKCKKHANRAMWHFDSVTKKCTEMVYRGCGGNANRWCNKQECKKCRR